MIPAELLYLLIALILGLLLYRYFTGRGGIELLRDDYAGLPAEGQVEVRSHLVRWRATDEVSFAAAWQLASGHPVVMHVRFDEADGQEQPRAEPDLGHLDISVGGRSLVSDVGWTEKIRDRTLRADVEAVLKALAREARVARSDATRVAAAKPVGDERDEHPGRSEDPPGRQM